jgi:hypothetical protein
VRIRAENALPSLAAARSTSSVTVEIGGQAIRLLAKDRNFLARIKKRYAGFVARRAQPKGEFQIVLESPRSSSLDAELRVRWRAGRWSLSRGDFHAEWNPRDARGHIRQSASPYALDSVLRIVHSLLLAPEGGFLVHAASAIRHGRAWIFAGVSGAGKTTIAKLAPADVRLLTDEISYVVRRNQPSSTSPIRRAAGSSELAAWRDAGGYLAFGTPFVGDLGRAGESLSAPVAGLYLLTQGPHNSIQSVSAADALRGLLENILFFAEDAQLVAQVFQSACDFVLRVPVRRLTFVPDSSVWELIP